MASGSGHARLVWGPSRAGDRTVAAYQVYRDGRAYRRVRGRALRVGVVLRTPTGLRRRRRGARPAEQAGEGPEGPPSPDAARQAESTTVTDSRVRLS